MERITDKIMRYRAAMHEVNPWSAIQPPKDFVLTPQEGEQLMDELRHLTAMQYLPGGLPATADGLQYAGYIIRIAP